VWSCARDWRARDFNAWKESVRLDLNEVLSGSASASCNAEIETKASSSGSGEAKIKGWSKDESSVAGKHRGLFFLAEPILPARAMRTCPGVGGLLVEAKEELSTSRHGMESEEFEREGLGEPRLLDVDSEPTRSSPDISSSKTSIDL